jgi:hypothetical protein
MGLSMVLAVPRLRFALSLRKTAQFTKIYAPLLEIILIDIATPVKADDTGYHRRGLYQVPRSIADTGSCALRLS